MKKIFLILLISTTIFSCKKDDGSGNPTGSGGLQITSATFQAQFGAGAKLSGYTVDSGVIKIPVTGANLAYNYANITMGAAWKDTLKIPGTAFSGATYMSGSSLNLFGQAASFFTYYKIDNNSWTVLGDDVSAINATIPGTGSISSAAQTSARTPIQTMVNFPISYTDSFQQASTSSLSFAASATIPGIPLPINGPVTITQTTTATSKNLAWGTLKLKGYTDSMQCVVQKYTTSTSTSGSSTNPLLSAAIPQVLASAGIDPTKPTVVTTYRFWVANKGLVMTLNSVNGKAYVSVF